MTPRMENRLWRAAFLVAIVGCAIAAGSADRSPKFVSINERGDCLTEDGEIYRFDAVGRRLNRRTN